MTKPPNRAAYIHIAEVVSAPKDYTTEQIEAWLSSLRAAADEKAIHLLVERIDVISKTDFNIISTLESVMRETGCGGGI